jgi:glycerol uptake facilitator-like aquaporin
MAGDGAVSADGPARDPRAEAFADSRLESRRLLAEAVGTFFLVLVAAGAVVVNVVSHGQVGRAAAEAAPRIMVLALIYTIGETSGAHINPAVTVAFAARGHFPWRRVPGYLLAQLCGAVGAAGLLRLMFGVAGRLGGTSPGHGTPAWTALVMEIVLTAGLMTVILGTACGARIVGHPGRCAGVPHSRRTWQLRERRRTIHPPAGHRRSPRPSVANDPDRLPAGCGAVSSGGGLRAGRFRSTVSGMARGAWRRVSPAAAVVVMVVLGLVGNLATNTVTVTAWWWRWLVWGATAVLVSVAVGIQFRQRRGSASAEVAGGADRTAGGAVGRMIGDWDPVVLGVHRVVCGGAQPAYVRRRHDDLLVMLLNPECAANRLVVLRGGSSTGKSRAAYEAVAAALPDRPVYYPRTAAALARLIEDPGLAGSVVWLGELRHYVEDPDGGRPLGWLAEVLSGESGIVVITTLWPGHWAAYTASHHGGPGSTDPFRAARGLLEPLDAVTGLGAEPGRGGVIDVPECFGPDDLKRARQGGDPLVGQAISAAADGGAPGQIAQYLAGVPDLLAHYERPGADPYGQALIAAAMDAARLGHPGPYAPEFLSDAAIGYLGDRERTIPVAEWKDAAWAYAIRELKGAIRALEPVPPEQGTGVSGYRLADYLEQHGHHTRRDHIPPEAFWNAARAHAGPGGQSALGDAAEARGLLRYAALLRARAASGGDAAAAIALLRTLARLAPQDRRPAWHVATHFPAEDRSGADAVLRLLREVGATEPAIFFAARTAGDMPIRDPVDVRVLLKEFHEIGAAGHARTLAARVAAGTPVTATTLYLHELHAAGMADQVTALACRIASQSPLDDAFRINGLLAALQGVGAHRQIALLMTREPAAHVGIDKPLFVADLVRKLYEIGAAGQAAILAARCAAECPVDRGNFLARLIQTLREAGAADHAAALAHRAAQNIALDDPGEVADLLHGLAEAGLTEQAALLTARDPAGHAGFEHRYGVARLLDALRTADAAGQIAILIAREPGALVGLDDPYSVGELVRALREAGAVEQSTALAERAVAHADLTDVDHVAALTYALQKAKASEQATALTRNAVLSVDHDGPFAGIALLEELLKLRAVDHAHLLAARIAAQVPLDAIGIIHLLRRLLGAGMQDEFTALAERIAAHLPADPTSAVADLFSELWELGAAGQATKLAERVITRVPLDNPGHVADLLHDLREAHRAGHIATVLARDPAAKAAVHDPRHVALLLTELLQVQATDQAAKLARRAAEQMSLDNPRHVARLLRDLRRAAMTGQIATLLARDPAVHIPLNDPRGIAELICELRAVGATGQVTTLIARDLVSGVSLDYAGPVVELLRELRAAGADDQVAALADRAAAHTAFTVPGEAQWLLQALRSVGAGPQAGLFAERLPAVGHFAIFLEYVGCPERFRFGREPDGRPAPPWAWDDMVTPAAQLRTPANENHKRSPRREAL